MPHTVDTIDQSPYGVDKTGSKVRGMFAEIAPRYDLVNRMLSGGIDVWWRHVTVSCAPPPPHGAIVASDFCRPMLDRGVEKSARAGRSIEWVEADAMALPFPDAAFDLVTVAFGLRNIADTGRGLAEMARVLKPGGRLAILEFSLPANPIIRAGYLWYFRRVLPWIGNTVARNASDAYSYLNKSVEEFPTGERLAALVRTAGFAGVEMVPLTFGIATLSIATRRGSDG